jgi:MFS transporter, ACS family, D-galactonate transporter
MEQGSRASSGMMHRRRYFVAVMLLLMVMLGYIDRVNMSVAGPDIADELGLSAGTLGLLFSAFFWSYTAMLVPLGWLSDRYGTRVVIPLAIVVWCLPSSHRCGPLGLVK